MTTDAAPSSRPRVIIALLAVCFLCSRLSVWWTGDAETAALRVCCGASYLDATSWLWQSEKYQPNSPPTGGEEACPDCIGGPWWNYSQVPGRVTSSPNMRIQPLLKDITTVFTVVRLLLYTVKIKSIYRSKTFLFSALKSYSDCKVTSTKKNQHWTCG